VHVRGMYTSARGPGEQSHARSREWPTGAPPHARQVHTTAGGSGKITYSRSYTIVPTYECFNKCTYCNFRKDVGRDNWLDLDHAWRTLQDLRRNTDVCEILVLSGEVHPRSKRRAAWVDRIEALCKCVAQPNRGQLLFTSELVGASTAAGLAGSTVLYCYASM
jgi:hypothetical protein